MNKDGGQSHEFEKQTFESGRYLSLLQTQI